MQKGRAGSAGAPAKASRQARSLLPPEAPARFEARVLPDIEALAEAAAREFRSSAEEAIAARGIFRVALSGGSTPRVVHRRLTEAPFRRAVDWAKVFFYFGDERCVPPDSDRSNYRMARETLFEPLRIPPDRIFRMRGEDPAKAAADAYGSTLRESFGMRAGSTPKMPRFDLVFLGLGPDGHTASLFPGTRALTVADRPVAANWVPKFREWRITLTYPALNAALRVIFLAAGAEKTGPAGTILRKARGASALPASRVRPRRGTLLWLLDEEAAKAI